MKKILILLFMLATGVCGFAADPLLDDIEKNNTTLRALRAQMEAEKAEARSGLALPDPEVEFAYLWGSPTPAPGRKDVSFSQTLDFATISGARRRVANRQCDVAELEYRRARQQILLEAQQSIINLQCADTLLSLSRHRLAEAQQTAEGWHKRLEHGEAEAIEVGKIDLAVTLLTGEVQQAEVERTAVLAQLTTLNGGQPIASVPCDSIAASLPPSFDEWYQQVSASSPVIQYAAAQERLAAQQLKLAKSENMPQLSVGYMGELVKGDNYQGVKAGLTIPLWGNSSRVKAARAAHEAAEATLQDAAVQFCGNLRAQYDRTLGLLRVAQTYEAGAAKHDNGHLLQKALVAGQITLTDYLSEMALRHETQVRVIEAWRDYRLAIAQLYAVQEY